MIDEDLFWEIRSYLPVKYNLDIEEYLEYHFEEFKKSIEHQLAYGIFVHLHIIYMIFVYWQFYRIVQSDKKTFDNRFNLFINNKKQKISDNEKTFKSNLDQNKLHCFDFSLLNERTIFDFFDIYKIGDEKRKVLKNIIDIRNKLLHATGHFLFTSQQNYNYLVRDFHLLEDIVNQYTNNMQEIIQAEIPLLSQQYNDLYVIMEEFEIDHDVLELNIYLLYGFSQKELEILTHGKTDKLSLAIKNDLGFEE